MQYDQFFIKPATRRKYKKGVPLEILAATGFVISMKYSLDDENL